MRKRRCHITKISATASLACLCAFIFNLKALAVLNPDINPEITLPQPKGTIYLGVNLPNINVFDYVPRGQSRKFRAGFLGLGVHADYYHRDNRFFSVMGSAVVDYEIPAPAGIHRTSGEWDNTFGLYTGVTYNHRFDKLALGNHATVGYGVSYGTYHWKYQNLGNYEDGKYVPPDRENENNTHYAGGLLFNTTFVPFRRFQKLNFGVNYRPTFMRFGIENKWLYEHHIGFLFGFKFKVR